MVAERLHMYYNHTKKSALLEDIAYDWLPIINSVLYLNAALKEFDQLKKDYADKYEEVR